MVSLNNDIKIIMNTNEMTSEELKKTINELRERLFGGLKKSLEELDEFFNKHIKSGQIDPGYELQYERLLNEFKKQLDEFRKK